MHFQGLLVERYWLIKPLLTKWRDIPIQQFLADLERIPFHSKEQIHRGLENLGNRMEVEGNDDSQ
jgi:hypothetical protein